MGIFFDGGFAFFPVFFCCVTWRALRQCVPHGVEDSSVLHDAEQLVGSGHVVGDGPLAIPEECVRRPDFTDHEVVEPQDLDWTVEFESLVDPCLSEKYIHCVFLKA